MFSTAIELFWRKHPALLLALALLIGFSFGLTHNWWLLIPLGFLWIPLLAGPRSMRRLPLLHLLLLIGGALFIYLFYLFPTLPEKGVEGVGRFSIQSLTATKTHFDRGWLYKGTLAQFTAPGIQARNLPCTLFVSSKQTPPSADQDYLIQGTLKQGQGISYQLKPSLSVPWVPVSGSWSLAQLRYQAHTFVAKILQTQLSLPSTRHFLMGLTTGQLGDTLLANQFSKLGLQHIVAISGFHFSIIASLLWLLLRIFLKPRYAALCILVCSASYLLFLNLSPSVERAWVSISIAFLGKLIHKRTTALNALGAAMIAVLITDPLSCLSIAFQFSFGITAAILLLYPLLSLLLKEWLPQRPLSTLICMSRLQQHGYVIVGFFREALALCLAVNLVALPLTLFHFHKFPLLSLLYNLFFPPLVSLSLLLLVAGFALLIIPGLGAIVFKLNELYTTVILDLPLNAPAEWNHWLYCLTFPSGLLLSLLSSLFFTAIVLTHSAPVKTTPQTEQWLA